MALLGRRCKTRLERRAIVRHIRYDLSAKRGGGNVHRLLTRGILTLSPIVRSLASPYNSSPSFPTFFHFDPLRPLVNATAVHLCSFVGISPPSTGIHNASDSHYRAPASSFAPAADNYRHIRSRITHQPRRPLHRQCFSSLRVPYRTLTLSLPQCHTPAPKTAQLPRLMSPIRLHRTKRSLVRLFYVISTNRSHRSISFFPRRLLHLVARSSDKGAAPRVPHVVGGTTFVRMPLLPHV